MQFSLCGNQISAFTAYWYRFTLLEFHYAALHVIDLPTYITHKSNKAEETRRFVVALAQITVPS